jgi:hypothetical protein
MGIHVGSKQNGASQGSVAKPSWLLKGKEAKDVADEHADAAEERKANRDKLWRYYLKPEASGRLFFLNGDIVTEGEEKGSFDIDFVEEHKVTSPGSKVPSFYVCVSRTETCPLCEAGNFASFVGLFGIIDTTIFVDREGKEHKNRKRIFAAKGQTIKKLAKKAKANGGSLAGVMLDVSRSDSRSATVGDDFDLVGAWPLEALGKRIDPAKWQEVIAVPDFANELTYLSAAEMREKFHFDAPNGPGYQGQSKTPGDDAPSYPDEGDDELPIPGGDGGDTGSIPPGAYDDIPF